MTAAPGGPQQPYNSDPNQQGQYNPGGYDQGQYNQGQYNQGQYNQGQYNQGAGQAAPYGQPYPGAAPTQSSARGPLIVIGVLAIVGGIVAAIGSFLDWVSITVPAGMMGNGCATISVSPMGSMTACGQSMDLPTEGVVDAWFTLAGGVLAAIGGLILIAATGARQAGASLALIGGLVAAGFGIYNMLTAGDDIKEGLTSTGAPADAFDVSPAIGLWMVIIGGVVAAIAGIAGLVKKA